MKLYVVRHGQTDWNVEGKFQGKTDICLNDTGRNQALKVRNILKDKNINLCICSPLKRAKETASNIVNDKYMIIENELLTERCLGYYEGKDRESSGYDGNLYWNYTLDLNTNGVESIKKLFSRVTQFLEDIHKKYSNKNVLIVSHGATIRALNYIINGYVDDEKFLELDVPNCSVLEYDL